MNEFVKAKEQNSSALKIQGFAARREVRKAFKSLHRWRILSLLVLISLLIIDISGQFQFLVPIFLLFPLLDLRNQVRIWYNHIRKFGLPPLRHCLKMWRLDAKRGYDPKTVTAKQKDRGHVLPIALSVLLFSGLLCFLWTKTGFASLLYFSVAFAVMAVKGLIRRARPPAVLFLAKSRAESDRLQLRMSQAVYPLEVSSCLYHEKSEIATWMAEILFFKSYRTGDDKDWKEMVSSLVEICPIVVLDIQESTKPLEFEIELVLKTIPPDRLYFLREKHVQDLIPSSRCFSQDRLVEALRLKLGSTRGKYPHRKETCNKIFRDKKNHYFMFSPPVGWEVYEYPDSRTKVQFSHPDASDVYLRLIIRETSGDNYYTMLSANREMERQLKDAGMAYEVEEKEFLCAKCIETRAHSRDDGTTLFMRKFLAGGLHFNIQYGAPTKALYDQYLDTAKQSLDTIVVLKNHKKSAKKARDQQAANHIRLAELAAESKSVEEARRILCEAAEEFPESKLIQDALDKLRIDEKT